MWLRPPATGPATPNPARRGMACFTSAANAWQMAPSPGNFLLS